MINPADLRSLVVYPTLQALGLWSGAAEHVVMAAAAQASALARLRGDGGRLAAGHATPGPAEPLGLWGISTAQHDQLVRWLARPARAELRERLTQATGVAEPHARWLAGHLPYGAAITRLRMVRCGPLPPPHDLAALAAYAGQCLGPGYRAALDGLGRVYAQALREALAARSEADIVIVGA